MSRWDIAFAATVGVISRPRYRKPLGKRPGKDVRAYSAGSAPSGRVNPRAIEVLEAARVETSACAAGAGTISCEGAPETRIVITVCDNRGAAVANHRHPAVEARPTHHAFSEQLAVLRALGLGFEQDGLARPGRRVGAVAEAHWSHAVERKRRSLKISVSASPDVLPHSRTMPSKFLPSSAARDAGAASAVPAIWSGATNSERIPERIDMAGLLTGSESFHPAAPSATRPS